MMRRKFRKGLILFFLLPVYGIGSVGFFTTYWTVVHRTSFQSRVRKGDMGGLTEFHFTQQEFNNLDWTEKNREFRLHDKMYDISEIDLTSEGYRIVCKHDKLESFVVGLFSFHKNRTNGKSATKKFGGLTKVSPKYCPLGFSYNPELRIAKSQIGNKERIFSLPFYADVDSPPPESLA